MKFAVLDVETTGSHADDEVIQFGLSIVENGEIQRNYSSCVYTDRIIPEFIVRLTGITQEIVQAAPTLEDVLPELLPLLDGCILVGHNVNFDLDFLQRSLVNGGYAPFDGRVLDTMDLLRMLFPQLGSLRLGMVCQEFGIPLERAHQADQDAEATAKVWLHCLDKLHSVPLLTLQRLSNMLNKANRTDTLDLAWLLDEIRMQRERQAVTETNTGTYFRQFHLRIGDWREEDDEGEYMDDLADQLSFADFYDQVQHSLRQSFDHYEEREEQKMMIQEVYDSFEGNKHLLIEAGTGTGKSLAYLLPALYSSLTQGQKIVISTHTINLQEQLRTRDIPLLQQVSPLPFKAAVLKGRNHYLCLRKFEQRFNLQDFDSRDQLISAGQILIWLGETEHGDDEELQLNGRARDFWRSVESDTHSCLNRACPWFTKCFYHRARHEAVNADLLITNHSMLLTDVRADNRLIPHYDRLVIDEAHHFEQTASKHMGIEISYFQFLNSMHRLLKDARNGPLVALVHKLSASSDEQAGAWAERIETTYPLFVQVKEDWEHLSELLYQMAQGSKDATQGEHSYVYRIRQDRLPAEWKDALLMEDNLYMQLGEISKTLEKVLNELKQSDNGYELQSMITDLTGHVNNLTRIRDSLRFNMKLDDSNYVYWIEANGQYRNRSVHLISVPIDVSAMLQEHFFSRKDSIVMTSATLSVNQTFDYAVEQLGLGPDKETGRLETVLLPSTFNYQEQSLVLVPRDFPSVKGTYADADFIHTLCRSLADVAIETKGRFMVLFTSYRMLRQVHGQLKDHLSTNGIQVFGQGIESNNRSKLIRMFQDTAKSVLLGTSSFWEGIDIPGEALSCLAIVRLPFQPPNHPFVEAKCDYMKSQNLNPFMKYSVPQAVIQFKQGFGRLVRTVNDKGIVIVYDTRVVDTQYGKYFLRSLPKPRIENATAGSLVPRIREWLLS